MLLIYQLLSENRNFLVGQLVQQVRSESRLYHRISRLELKESMESMVDAYTDFLISKNKHKLKIILGYWVRVRLSQSFHLSAILKAALCFGPVLRIFLQKQEALDYDKSMHMVEKAVFEMTDILIEIFEEQKTTHRPKRNLDLSKLTIFRG